MKVFFDTNVYVAEALVGGGAARMIEATKRGKWRIYASSYVIAELVRVLTEDLGFSSRLAALTQRRIVGRSALVSLKSTAKVPQDPNDSPILQAALSCGADFLVTNDRHLLSLHPFEGLEIVSMRRYTELLREHGLMGR
jgi:putative PIN family toxin of toxin-antitoxin system